MEPGKDIEKLDILKLKTSIIKKYRETIEKLIWAYSKSNPDVIYISPTALNDALDEAIKDILILKCRRQEFDRFSKGKIAGAISFRLCRWNIINTDSKILLRDRMFLKMNYLIAFTIGLNYMNINYNSIKRHVRNEIMYTMIRRHVNQETLGIVFDTLRDRLES